MSVASRLGRSLPGGFLGMLTLVVAIEWVAVRDNLDFMDNVATSWKYTGRVAARKVRGKQILCFGDSLLKFGVLPKVVGEQAGRSAYSLSLQSGSAPASYFLLNRALRAGARPEAVVVDFARGILGDGPASITRPYPWPDLLTFREALDLCRQARDPDLFASILVRWCLHSDKVRYEIRANILAALNGKRTGQRDIAPALWRNWNTNDGGQANPRVPPIADEVVPPDSPIQPGNWRCDRVNEHYVRLFLETARRHHIRVYWLIPPVTPGTLSKWVHEGNEGRYNEFVERWQMRYPELEVIDGRTSRYPSEVFVDGVHLDRVGATALSIGVGRVLRERLSRVDHQHWIRLPDFQKETTDVPVEDVAQSQRAMASLLEKKRR
jgi:hypothetical protein